MKKTVLFCLLFLGLILLIEKTTNIDLYIQDLFFDFNKKEWIINQKLHLLLSPLFYQGMKALLIISLILAFLGYLSSFCWPKWSSYRFFFLMTFLGLAFVPLLISSAKQITNVYCPVQIERYGGQYPFVRIIESYPSDFSQNKKGKCFPAGHATTGFAFLALYFAFTSKRLKYLGLGIGLFLGTISGVYQMLRGQHFLSHTLFTFVLSWLILTLINYLLVQLKEKKYGNFISPRSV